MNYQEALDQHPIFDTLAKAAKKLNYPTYIIGGWVRDLLLKRPSKDIDVVCQGSGIELARAAAQLLNPKPKVSFFKNFGTANFRFGEYEVEFVGARKESYRRDSRKPIVEDGTLEDDQNRRDFTINALAISLNSSDYGELVDPFDGLKDLKRRIIKTPLEPTTTFSDDPLRMMRAVRFASQLGFDIEPDTFDALQTEANRLKIISQERITTELNKIILSNPPSYGFQLLFASSMLPIFFPEMQALHGVEKIDGKSHKDNFYHTLKVLDNVAQVSDDLWLRWAAILHDIAKPPTKRFHPKAGWTFHGHEDKGARMVPGIFRRLKLPMGSPMRFVQKMVKLHLRPIALVKKDITDSAVRRLLFEAGEDVEALMKLCRADITSKNHDRVKRYLQNFDLVEKKMVTVEDKDRVRNFQPVISGEMIMQTFNIGPSKPVGEIKEALKEAVLEGEIKNSLDNAFPFMIKLGKERGLTATKSLEDYS